MCSAENEDNRFSRIISSVKACRKEGHNSVIRKMLSMGQSVEFISQCTGRSADYIQQIAQEEPMLVREEVYYDESKKSQDISTD